MEHTLLSALWQKLVAFVAEHSLREIGTFLLLAFVAGLLSALVVSTEPMVRLLGQVVAWHAYAPLKVATVFALVFNARRIIDFMRAWFAAPPDSNTIEEMPTAEVLDWLFSRRSFQVDEVTDNFQAKRYRVERLVKKLKELQVLVADPANNNASVLNAEFSRQDVASIFRGKRDARELEPLFRKKDGYLTSVPSAKEIEERVAPLLSGSGFTSKTLA